MYGGAGRGSYCRNGKRNDRKMNRYNPKIQIDRQDFSTDEKHFLIKVVQFFE
jgi:hypothetical protein